MQAQANAPPRPRDILGPPTRAQYFGLPKAEKGLRMTVMAFSPEQNANVKFRNVLLRDWGQSWENLQAAYAPVDSKADLRKHSAFVREKNGRIETDREQGYLQICHVLRPERTQEGVTLKLTDECVAVKVCYGVRLQQVFERRHISSEHRAGGEDPLTEMFLLQRFGQNRLPHVGYCHEVLHVRNNSSFSYNVVMPYFIQGDMFSYIYSETPRASPALEEGEARGFFGKMMKGLRCLHDSQVCHADMKIENLMVDGDDIIIIDFGMAVQVPYREHEGIMKRCLVFGMGQFGTHMYMAPEIYREEAFDSEAIDVWSAGVTLFCLVTGQRPYSQASRTDLLFRAMTEHLDGLLASGRIVLSLECIDLMKGMIKVDPRLRLSIDEVLAHAWLR